METNNENKRMDEKRTTVGFETAWERRQRHWKEQAEETLPDDAVLLGLAERTRQQAQQQGEWVPPVLPRRRRWIPYAAAASLLVGVVGYGLARHDQPGNGQPVAEEVRVEGQTFRFLCNRSCSIQDVLFAVGDVMKP